MGIVKIGKVEYESNNISLSSNRVVLDGRVIMLDENSKTIKLSFKDCKINRLNSSLDIILEGIAAYLKSGKDICIWGRVLRPSYGLNKFYNMTAMEEYRRRKVEISRKVSNGRMIIHCSGDFDNVNIFKCSFPVEVYVKGSVNKCSSYRDIYCKGSVEGSRSDGNTYISKQRG